MAVAEGRVLNTIARAVGNIVWSSLTGQVANREAKGTAVNMKAALANLSVLKETFDNDASPNSLGKPFCVSSESLSRKISAVWKYVPR